MNVYRQQAVETLNRLHEENRIDYQGYCDIHDGLNEIETLRDRDEELEKLWGELEDIPMNPETECLEAPFMDFPVGTPREDIWHWFDQRHSQGVYFLLYGAELNREKVYKLIQLGDLCFECETSDCCFNRNGLCRFSLVHERKPRITDNDGCIDYDHREVEV